MSIISVPAYSADFSCAPWPLWQAYWDHFVQADGRVIDHGEIAEPSYSEGQAYTLFFTLIQNDRPRFELILNWIQREMANNDLYHNLPAWKWGQRSDNDWGIMDHNPASDADMWLAYSLIEAGRLWQSSDYTKLGNAVLQNIKQHELVYPPNEGVMLSPGAEGFNHIEMWRFNPSYFPIQQLRFFANHDKAGPWQDIQLHALGMLKKISPHGFVPDWTAYHDGKGWGVDVIQGPGGSYDAIRVYLWAGMLNDQDKSKTVLLKKLNGMQRHLYSSTTPPHLVNTQTGQVEGEAPAGFSAALLPYLQSLNEKKLLEIQLKRLNSAYQDSLVGKPARYYDQVLTLFGQGWLEGRFSFNADGSLKPAWPTCQSN